MHVLLVLAASLSWRNGTFLAK